MKVRNGDFGDFPGGPVVRTPCFHCRRHGFNPWWGHSSHMPRSAAKKKKRNSDFTVEKPGRYYLTQAFRVDVIRMERVGILYLLKGHTENTELLRFSCQNLP